MKFFKRDIPIELNNQSGIYKIVNEINGKVYIGKTVSFRKRYANYKTGFKKQDIRKINQYFLNAINKHGAENFTFSVVEVCGISETAERELYWMQEYRSLEPTKGYNLRMDSSTGLIVDQRTREKISKRVKQEFEDGIRDPLKVSKFFSEFWKDNPCIKEGMKKAVSASKCSFFLQKTLEDVPIVLWNGINQVIENNEGFKFQNIYAACNGSKKTYRGYKWERFDSLPLEYEHLLSDLKFSYGNARFKQEKSLFEMENSPPKALYIYKVSCKDQKFTLLYRGLGVITHTISTALYKSKADEVSVKGFTVKRERFNSEIVDFNFLNAESDRFKHFVDENTLDTEDNPDTISTT